MTVSPEWPQDGKRRPRASKNGAESGDPSNESALPPTLFRLPDLNREERGGKPQPAALNPSQPAPDDADADSSSGSKNPPPPQAEQPAEESPEAKQEDSEKDQKKGEKKDAPPRAPLPPSTDQPAGRSWMETFGSHGMVIILLMTVVGAALVSSRNHSNRGLDSLAESEPLEEPEAFDPSLTRQANSTAELAWSVDRDPFMENQEPARYEPPPAFETATPMVDGSTPVQPLAANLPRVQNLPVVHSEHPLVSLEPPHATVATADNTSTPSYGLPQGTRQLAEPAQVEMFTASDRSEPSNGDFELPTLDEWFQTDEGERDEEVARGSLTFDPEAMFETQESASQGESARREAALREAHRKWEAATAQRAARRFGSQYQYTETPVGVADWTQYFPEYQPRRTARAGTSSSSR